MLNQQTALAGLARQAHASAAPRIRRATRADILADRLRAYRAMITEAVLEGTKVRVAHGRLPLSTCAELAELLEEAAVHIAETAA